MSIIKGVSVKTPNGPTVMNATDAQVPTQASAATNVDLSMTNSPGAATSPRSLRMTIDYYNQLFTPILVDKLESALIRYPDSNFVSQVCNNLRFGAPIGFEGQRTPKFSRNLPTAMDDPMVVTNNLAHEISLGATILAFFGFLRLGELTCDSKFNPDTHLTPDNISFNCIKEMQKFRSMTILIKESKPEHFRVGQTITIGATSSILCPVQAISYKTQITQ